MSIREWTYLNFHDGGSMVTRRIMARSKIKVKAHNQMILIFFTLLKKNFVLPLRVLSLRLDVLEKMSICLKYRRRHGRR